MSDTINQDQTGFIRNHFIGENYQLIYNIITECDAQNKRGC